MGQCVGQCIEGKLEHALWEGLHCGRPQVCSSAMVVPYSLALHTQTCTVGQAGFVVCSLYFRLDLGGNPLPCGTRVIFYHFNHFLEWATGRSLQFGFLQCFLGGNGSHYRVSGVHVAGSLGCMELLVQGC